MHIKETVSVVSNDPACKDGNAWFTTVPFRALSNQVSMFIIFNTDNFQIEISVKKRLHISTEGKWLWIIRN